MSNNITQTTVSASFNQNATTIQLASVTNISAPVNNFRQKIYVINLGQMKGELMSVLAVNGNYVSVERLDEFRQSFYTGAIVMIAPLQPLAPLGGFYDCNPYGAPLVAGSYPANTVITPWLNVVTGEQWVLGLNNVWVPAWNNPAAPGGGIGTLVTATAAVLPTPTAPVFHVAASGTPAVTGIPIPTGMTGGSIVLIPDAAFTWTTGDGSIAVGGTAVQYRALTMTLDPFAAKWYPSYV